MNYEEINENFKKVLEEKKMKDIYEKSIKKAELSKAIAENSNFFEKNIIELGYLIGLVSKLDIDILIDEKKLQEITGSPIYDNSIRLALYFYKKKETPDYLTEVDNTLIKILKDTNTLEEFEMLKSKETLLNGTEVIRDELISPLEKKNAVPIELANNEAEKLLFTISKVFDINFKFSFYKIEENKYIDEIFTELLKKLKEKDKIKKIYALLKKHTTESL